MSDAVDPFGMKQKPRHEVETAALEGNGNLAERGAAKAELLGRDREYAEALELLRRKWEDQRDHHWRTYENNRRAAERAHDREDELWRLLAGAVTRDAQAAIRIVLAVNGGVAAAVLAFTAALVSRRAPLPMSSITPIVGSLKWFAFGAISAGAGAVFVYLTNAGYGAAAAGRERAWEHPFVLPTAAANRWRYAAYVFHALGALAALAGLGLFVYGLFKVQQKIGSAFR
jgi:hypothetical protein